MTRRKLDGWTLYLVMAACLVPVLVPPGPAQTAIPDVLMVFGLGAFGLSVLAGRQPQRVPFLGPVIVISVSSIAAVVSAEALSISFLTMLQDAYLYLWFIMLVNVMRQENVTILRLSWVWVANVVAVLGIVLVLFSGHATLLTIIGPKGARAFGTFPDSNMFASYLVMSLFMVLSLGGGIGRGLRWASILLLGAALVATKSNGGMSSLIGGLAIWAVVRARTKHLSPVRVAGVSLIVVSAALLGFWMTVGLGVGGSGLRALTAGSFIGRAEHSSEGRMMIWKQLQRAYAKSPLGIGPGNSGRLTLEVGGRERANSLQSKEAHNDYLAYFIERGPFGLLGLLALQAQAFGKIATWWRKRVREGTGGDPEGALAAAVVGALVAASMHALTIEVLHFRHFWMLLAMICALEVVAVGGRAPQRRRVGEVVDTPPERIAAVGA